MAIASNDLNKARRYALYRYQFPDTVNETILNFMDEHGTYETKKLAIDVGCGTGTTTRALVHHFKEVVGLDVNEEFLEEARKSTKETNVSYRNGKAEDLSSFSDTSVDLVTAAGCAHWFELDTFFAEATRVLRPGGVLAIYSGGSRYLECQEAGEYLDDMETRYLASYMSPKLDQIRNMYRDVKMPFPGVRVDDIIIERRISLEHFLEDLKTITFYQEYCEKNQGGDLMDTISHRLGQIYRKLENLPEDTSNDDIFLNISWPVVLLLGRK